MLHNFGVQVGSKLKLQTTDGSARRGPATSPEWAGLSVFGVWGLGVYLDPGMSCLI